MGTLLDTYRPCIGSRPVGANVMDDLQTLEAQQAVNSKFLVSPKSIKPCVAYVLVHNPKNKIFNANNYAYLIATELRRIGEDREKAAIILRAWNNGNIQALKLNELDGIIQRAYSKDYNYGCNNPIVVEYCPGKESCTYYKNLFRRRGSHRERDFYKYGWQKTLTPTQICLYHGLKELEKVLRLRPGELITASYNFISLRTGIAKSHLTENFNKLEKVGLIDWRKGEPYKWRKTASQIRRIIPIPRPKNDAKMRSL